MLAVAVAAPAACTSSGGKGGPDGVVNGSGGALGSGTGGSAGGAVPPGSGGRGQTAGGGAAGPGSGGTRASGGTPGGGGHATGGTTASGGAASPGSGGATGGSTASCSGALGDRIRVTEIDVGASYAYNEVDNNGANLGLTPLALSPLPGGGARLAFLGKGDSTVHIVTLGADDQVTGTPVTLPAYDFQDLYADATGGVVLVSRDALGATANHNCGDINNLCGLVANYPTTASCYDMYLVRFDQAGEI